MRYDLLGIKMKVHRYTYAAFFIFRWAETKKTVFITFSVADCKDAVVDIVDGVIDFTWVRREVLSIFRILFIDSKFLAHSGSNKDGSYACKLALRGDIDRENADTKFVVKARAIKVGINAVCKWYNLSCSLLGIITVLVMCTSSSTSSRRTKSDGTFCWRTKSFTSPKSKQIGTNGLTKTKKMAKG